jgi:hypothetical protein
VFSALKAHFENGNYWRKVSNEESALFNIRNTVPRDNYEHVRQQAIELLKSY